MRIDEHGAVIREQYAPGHPGDLGDSCADTSRLSVISLFPLVNLAAFRTPTGYVRHPLAVWRENDFSGDQALPLLMAYDLDTFRYPQYAAEMRQRLATGRTGNGDPLSPGLWGVVHKRLWLLGVACVVQAFLFLIPIRWSDSNDAPGPQWGGDEGDYLNWIPSIDYLWANGHRWTTHVCYRIRSPRTAGKKVSRYYANQPRSEWVTGIFMEHLDIVKKRLQW